MQVQQKVVKEGIADRMMQTCSLDYMQLKPDICHTSCGRLPFLLISLC